MKKLIVYPNCSKGGVATVIRGRAVAEPRTEFHCVFMHDRGGRDAFSDLPNVHVRIVRPDRVASFVSYLAAAHGYSRISILSSPKVLNDARFPDRANIAYEFHSSNMQIVRKELDEITLGKVTEIVVPSQFMADRIATELHDALVVPLRVVPNLIDTRLFHEGPPTTGYLDSGVVPLFWIGRFDKDKGVKYFLRMLSRLPETYHGYVVVSLESDPARAADFLGEAGAAGIQSRVHLLMNVPQLRLSEMFREAAHHGGALISTSLMESFGYSVVEALGCGLSVHAFELPPFSEHADPRGLLHQVEIGDVSALAQSVLARDPLTAA